MIELDKRIISGKKPLTCFDTEQAQDFVGKKCYLTNDISLFSDLDVFKDIEGCKSVPNEYDGIINTLSDIDTEISMVFETTYLRWKFCIPCEWVKKENTYRPYTINEFVNQFSLGDEIILRPKSDGIICHKLFVEYAEYNDGDDTVFLGSSCYGLTDLYEDCEIYTGEGWKPFGVKE